MYQQIQGTAPGQGQIPGIGTTQALPPAPMTGYPNLYQFQGIGDQPPRMTAPFDQFHPK
jgi:hypothetical protein